MRDDFSTLDIVRALGIPRGRLREWVDLGFIKPSVMAEGQGTKAVFTRHEVYGVAIFRLLVGLGFTRPLAASYTEKFIDEMRTNPKRNPTRLVFKSWRHENEIFVSSFNYSGKFDRFYLETAEVAELRELDMIPSTIPEYDWETAFIVNFEHIRAEVDSALNGI